MMHRMLLQDLGGLELRLDQVLLQTLPQAISGFRDLLDRLELVLISIENRQRLRVIEQFEVDFLDLFLDITRCGFVTMLGELGVLFCLGLLQREFAGTWNILRDAESGVIKVAAFIARKRLRTSNSEMLERHLWIRQRRCLDRDFRLSLPVAPGRQYDRAARNCLGDQRSQSNRTW